MPLADNGSEPLPASTFTAHDRERLVEVSVTMGFVRDSLSEIKQSIKDGATAARTDNRELEGRVRALENFRWWVLGGSAAAAVASEILFKYLSKS